MVVVVMVRTGMDSIRVQNTLVSFALIYDDFFLAIIYLLFMFF